MKRPSAMEGFLPRSGITVGNIHIHEEECVFGPGLNRAHKLESKIARFPRFVFDRDIAGEIGKTRRSTVLEDDVLFLNPFRLGFMDYMKAQHVEVDKDFVLAAGLPAPENKLPQHRREPMLRAILRR